MNHPNLASSLPLQPVIYPYLVPAMYRFDIAKSIKHYVVISSSLVKKDTLYEDDQGYKSMNKSEIYINLDEFLL